MQLNCDPAERALVRSTELPWLASPAAGVLRRLLERDGAEDARATSVVRYLPGASFARHSHPAGEEIFVLDGEFADEHGSYPAGSYLKNPPGSAHTPSSPKGCTLFVKLRHLPADDRQRVVVRPADWHWRPGLVDGLQVQALDAAGRQHTALVRWAPGTRFNRHQHWGGEEIFVLEGTFQDEFGDYPAGTWLRSPHLSAHQPYSEPGCLILVKTGHLA